VPVKRETVVLALFGIILITGFALIALGQMTIGASIVAGFMLFTWIVGDWARSRVST